jgi:PKD repeat protein
VWNFGDGSSSTLPNPSHTYLGSATYNARLTVTDSAGGFDSVAVVIVVNAPTTLRSSDIALTAEVRKRNVTVYGDVTVLDASGAPLPGAAVAITWTLPNGKRTNQTVTTSASGVASFSVKGGLGTYVLAVNDITKSGYVFDSANSVLSASITK